MTQEAARLKLYSREYCHLCHDMLAALEALRGECPAAFTVEVVDIDAEAAAALLDRYDELVPVLVALEGDGDAVVERELCHYFLDKPAVIGWLAGYSAR